MKKIKYSVILLILTIAAPAMAMYSGNCMQDTKCIKSAKVNLNDEVSKAYPLRVASKSNKQWSKSRKTRSKDKRCAKGKSRSMCHAVISYPTVRKKSKKTPSKRKR